MGAGPALARSLEEQVFSALRRQGYSNLNANRTFLGRLRVTGTKGKKNREVILNRQTGEVLRDVVREGGGYGSVFESDSSDTDDDRDDDSDRDDDRDRDDDNDSSGRGRGRGGDSDDSRDSGSSGSGSGGDSGNSGSGSSGGDDD